MADRGSGRPRGGRLGVEVRERFWDALSGGSSMRAAARAAGVSHGTGGVWLAQAGGMPPPLKAVPRASEPPTGSRRMSFVDRCRIQELHQAGHRPARIAVLVGRARSTITRELVRGADPDGQYRASLAQSRVEAAGRRPKQPRLVANPRLRAAVVEGLARRHSPQQVSGRLRRDHPDDPEMWVSHETIYQALYVQPAVSSLARCAPRSATARHCAAGIPAAASKDGSPTRVGSPA